MGRFGLRVADAVHFGLTGVRQNLRLRRRGERVAGKFDGDAVDFARVPSK